MTHNIFLIGNGVGWADHWKHSWAIQRLHLNCGKINRRRQFWNSQTVLNIRCCATSKLSLFRKKRWGLSLVFKREELSNSKSGLGSSDWKRLDTSEISRFSALSLVVSFVSSVRPANVWRADLLMMSLMETLAFLTTVTNEGVVEILDYGR